MRSVKIFIFLFVVAANCAAQPSQSYSKAGAVSSVMKKYTDQGIPGLSIAVFTEEGSWKHASGFAKTESKTPMTTEHLQYTQSVSKTFMAVVILKLYEQGKIKLDDPITKYLPEKHSRYIKNASEITVRMLLNHQSGVAEYNSNPAYVADFLMHPARVTKPEAALVYLENEKPQFAPGAEYRYTNTNYLLLALMADAITGDHASFIEKNIFQPLGMKNSLYRNSKGYLSSDRLPDSYWDMLNESKPVNITTIQRTNVASMIGDDGIVCTPEDAVIFLKGLMEGKLLSESSMALMKTWVNNKSGKPTYGMGLSYFDLGGIEGIGHGGGGIGAGCMLLYVPAKKTYIFLATNLGVVIGGPMPEKVGAARDEILATILQ